MSIRHWRQRTQFLISIVVRFPVWAQIDDDNNDKSDDNRNLLRSVTRTTVIRRRVDGRFKNRELVVLTFWFFPNSCATGTKHCLWNSCRASVHRTFDDATPSVEDYIDRVTRHETMVTKTVKRGNVVVVVLKAETITRRGIKTI